MAAEGVDSTMTIATAGRAAVGKTTLVLALQRGRPAADGTACESTIGVETASVLVKSGGQNHRMSVFDTSGEHRGAVLGAVRAWGGARAVRGASTPERAQLRPTLPACASGVPCDSSACPPRLQARSASCPPRRLSCGSGTHTSSCTASPTLAAFEVSVGVCVAVRRGPMRRQL